MTDTKPKARTDIAAALFYRDAPAAIDWLEQALGFRRRFVMPGPDGTILHSELSFGPDVLMVASARPDRGWFSPLDLNGATMSLCLVVDDADAAYARAKAAGFRITFDIEDHDYGGRGFTGLDPEGHSWSIGTYRAGDYWDEAAPEA